MSNMWIESHQNLRNHPKTIELAAELNLKQHCVIGHLHCMWWWALDYAPDGDLTAFSDRVIAYAAEYEGKPEVFVNALIKSGFLEEYDGNIYIHDWADYSAGRLKAAEKKEKDKENNRERQRRFREKQKGECSGNDGITDDVTGSNGDVTGSNGGVTDEKRAVTHIDIDIDNNIDIDNTKTDISSSFEEEIDISLKEKEMDTDKVIYLDTVPRENTNAVNGDICHQVLELYHTTCKSYPAVQDLTPNFVRDILNAISEGYRLSDFKTVFQKAENSAFLKGEVNQFKADFGWLIRSRNIEKVLEGKYDKTRDWGTGTNGNSNGQRTFNSYGAGGFKQNQGKNDWSDFRIGLHV